MSKFQVGPTGALLQGHLYDVNKYSFERAAQEYDSQLYLAWNSSKRRGLGCWELRRRPDKKTAVYQGHVDECPFFLVEPVENAIIHHVMDIPFLSYGALERLKTMDAWQDKYWVSNLEYDEKKHTTQMEKLRQSELRYNLKQDRSTFKVFKEMVASGTNPALIAQHWGQRS